MNQTGHSRALASWAQEVTDQERECPWPGPRPFDEADIDPWDAAKGRKLHGRDADLRRLCQRLESDYLLVLHGDSGVGKSSFLRVGLSRGLPDANFDPYVLSEWTQMKGDFGDYLTDRFRACYDKDMSDVRRGELENLGVDGLLSRLGGRPVLVLDQFEEFLRHSSWEAIQQFEQWLIKTNLNVKLRIVISLRSELLYKLDPVLNEVRKFSLSRMSLDPITKAEHIAAMITDPATWCQVRIDSEVRDLLVSCFCQSAQIRDSFWLLNMQAVLYSLYWFGRRRPEQVVITRQDFTAWVDSWTRDGRSARRLPNGLRDFVEGKADWASPRTWHPTEVAEALAQAAFLRAVDTKLRHCQELSERIGGIPSQVMNPLVRDQLRRSLPHLSTGSYKDPQGLLDLFRKTYGDELARLQAPARANRVVAAASGRRPSSSSTSAAGLTHAQVEEIFDYLWSLGSGDVGGSGDLLTVTREQVLARTRVGTKQAKSTWWRETLEARAILQIDHVPWLEDENQVGAGPMMGCRPVEVIIEMIRCFLFAALWLERSLICGISDGQIRLIHDGFGDALKAWAGVGGEPAEAEIAAFVSMVGDMPIWGHRVTAFDREASASPRLVANLSWQSCQIAGVKFARTVFANCDFRNTRFERCTFNGATFVNCLLDGTLLSHCRIVGTASLEEVSAAIDDPSARGDIEQGGIPSFVVKDAPKDVLDSLAHFRGVFPLDDSWTEESPDRLLYSPTSGAGAMVVDRLPGGAGLVPEVPSGLVILGSRVSGLMVRGARFEGRKTPGRAGLVLGYVAGSSVDLVELEKLSLGIVGCALRGLSVSRPITDQGSRPARPGAFRAEVRDSLLVNTWFGDGLRGSVKISESTVFGLASLPHADELKVLLDETCKAAMTDNVATTLCSSLTLGGAGGWKLADGSKTLMGRDDSLRQVSRKTDYRSQGAQYELEGRAARLAARIGAAQVAGESEGEVSHV
ncbi:MAG: pentapeptide repeat-containing protein [Bifidobacteriaceae bacterium]|jgi:hypothetical protein|nr:pentapeptide repeat-containing protein [Bifidobacteriaceae bacterium]